MAMSLSRKLNAVSLAVVFGAGIAIAYSPYAAAWWRMHRFCSDLAPGAGYDVIRAQATALGYETSPIADGNARIDDPLSFGRRSCLLSFDGDRLRVAQ